MNEMGNEYIPGVCNIGPEERKFRRNSGLVSIAVAIIYLLFLYWTKAQNIYRVFLFLPFFTAAISLLQDRMHFCAEFGLLGAYNLGNVFGHVNHVKNKEYNSIDRKKALKIILYSFLIAIVLMIFFILLP